MLGTRVRGMLSAMVLVLLGLVVTPVMAQNLYQVTLKASTDEEEALLVNAFERMLLKVTGSHQRVDRVMQLPTLPPMTDLIYQQTRIDDTLQVSFNQYKVNQLLSTANIDVWPEPRPRVLVWIAQQSGQDKSIIAEYQPNELVSGIEEGAQQRALTVTLPLLDLDDLSAITFTDIWGRFLQPVVQASQRYQVNYIALIKAQYNDKTPDESQVIWQMIDNAGLPILQGEELGLLEDSGVALANQLADYFADNLASPPQAETDATILVDIDNIKGMADVVLVKRYFEQLTGVHQVTLVAMKPNGMQLSLKLLSSKEQLIQLLTEQGKIAWQEDSVQEQHLAVTWLGVNQANEAP